MPTDSSPKLLSLPVIFRPCSCLPRLNRLRAVLASRYLDKPQPRVYFTPQGALAFRPLQEAGTSYTLEVGPWMVRFGCEICL
jgi:hypothetical protein